jgi:hypothetical protein
MSLPQQSLAVDFFGSKDKERISYYQGYNAGIARTLELNTVEALDTTGVLQKDVSDLEKKINTLENQINSISIDDGGIDTLPGSYVNNPMTVDLDLGGYSFSNSASEKSFLYGSWGVENFLSVENGATIGSFHDSAQEGALRVSAVGLDFGQDAIMAYANAEDSNAIYGHADGNNSYAGKFDGQVEIDYEGDTGLNVHAYGNAVRGWSTSETGGAGLFGSGHTGVLGVANYPGGIGVYGQAFAGELAGKFDGSVVITEDLHMGPALPGRLTVLDENPGGIALSAGANGNDAKAGFFQANGVGGTALYAISSSTAGFFDGPVKITNGDLEVDNIKSSAEAVYFRSDANFTEDLFAKHITLGTIEPNRNNFSSFVGAASSSAAALSASGENSKALIANATGGAWAGWFDGDVMIGNLSAIEGNPITGIAALGVTDTGRPYSAAIMAQTEVLGGKAGVFKSNGDDSLAVYAKANGENSYAGYFDGDLLVDNGGELLIGQGNQSKIGPISGGWGGLMISSFLDVGIAIDANNDDPVSAFRVVADSDAPGAPSKPLFTAHSSGKIGINKAYPERTLDIYSETENAEIDLQSGDNTHWGIYQDNRSGNLNFWHGSNAVTFTEQGINTGQLCLDKKCIDDWSDLKDILDNIDPVDPVDPSIRPSQQ